jgi:hypothetical protein|tara:strand:- start:80 stop:613 length:534 start_codon:yes stop_codon:yes gene_type:complete
MKFFKIKSYYIVTDIKEHKKIKQKFLDLIDLMPDSSLNTISKTDWNLPREYKRKYLDYFYDIITPYMDTMAKKLKCKDWNISNGWFQVYGKNDTHTWHTHANSNYTNIYYISLPDKSVKTQVYDVVTKKIIDDFKVTEGQLLTLPANSIHTSPLNKTKNKKVIISFNSNFEDVDLNL